MKCPFCGFSDTKVLDSRPWDAGMSIRRRRECLACERRFKTVETIETLPLVVIKRDGSRQPFDRSKIVTGMLLAGEKRKISMDTINKIVDGIEYELHSAYDTEVQSEIIGEMVLKELKKLDEVAYVRFASVYRRFSDVNSFVAELNRLRELSE